MELDLKKLPEKDYFSLSEIAERWSCDLTQVAHYIYELGLLRLAVKHSDTMVLGMLHAKHSPPLAVVNIINILKNPRMKSTYESEIGTPLGMFDDYEDGTDVDGGLRVNFDFVKVDDYFATEYPKYFYLERDNLYSEDVLGIGSDKRLMAAIIHTFDGTCGYIVNAYDNRVDGKLDGFSFLGFDIFYEKIFNIITKEERDRFENKYGITSESKSVQEEVDQYEIGGHLPSIANGTIQASRELILRGWLAGRDIDFGTEVDLTRTQLWNELSKASSDLFRSLGKDAINDFFGLQKLCTFRRGRPKEGI
jgi:hypothetical protein